MIAACWSAHESAVKKLLAENSRLVSKLSEAYRRQIAHAARNNNLAALRIMLAAGLPVAEVGQHKATPLHWAAFHGNAEMAREILRSGKDPLQEARLANPALEPTAKSRPRLSVQVVAGTKPRTSCRKDQS